MALLGKIGALVKNVGDKTNEVIDVTRLNARIGGQRRMISDLQKKIGVLCWEKYEAGGALDDEIAKLCAVIKGGYEQIEQLKAEIRAAKEASGADPVIVEYTCPSCGSDNIPGTVFCKSCGARLEDGTEDETENAVPACPGCGIKNSPEAKFCKECGTKL